MNGIDRNHSTRFSFHDAIEPFLRACPGPAIAQKGLRIMAYQHVTGIPDLEGSGQGSSLRTVKDISRAVYCTPGHLTRVARNLGYSYGSAVRWITLFHAIALKREEYRWQTVGRNLGFSDSSGLTRFTKRLVGKTPTQLPDMPLEHWAMEGRARVFLFGRLGQVDHE